MNNDKSKDQGINRKDCAEAAKLIMGAFVWDNSQEGHEHWRRIVSRLVDLGNGKKL